MTPDEVIRKLNLVPLPLEGGFFRETFRSTHFVDSDIGRKTECTAIYYLVTENSFSLHHTVDQEEIFHFYAGTPVKMLQIINGEAVYITIGNDISKGHIPQVVVPRGTWQGTKLLDSKADAWALLGCTVAPGFEYENFHMKTRKELGELYPALKAHIAEFTYAD